MSSEVAIGEASWLHTEDSDRGQQSVDARVTEAERGCSLMVDDSWLRDGAENVFADGGIMTETFGIEETPAGPVPLVPVSRLSVGVAGRRACRGHPGRAEKKARRIG